MAVYKDLKTRLVADTCSEWQNVWKRALYVYNLAMVAIKQSRLQVDELRSFGGEWGGSVPIQHIYDVTNRLAGPDLEDALKNLRALSLCLSPQLAEEQPYHRAGIDERDHRGLAQLLSLCPLLEELHLHIYHLRDNLSEKNAAAERILDAVQLPHLYKCTLRGLIMREHTLLDFLHASPNLLTLELRNIELKANSWRRVFDYCGSGESKLEELTLERLVGYDGSLLLHQLNHSQVCMMGESLKLEGEQLRDGIGYESFWDCEKAWVPDNGEKREYGPPSEVAGRLDFDM